MNPEPGQTWTTKFPHVRDRLVLSVTETHVTYQRAEELHHHTMTLRNWREWIRGNHAVVKEA